MTAPRLYSDVFYIVYIQQMGAVGINSYAMALNNAFRGDITQYFNDCLTESKDLYIRVSDTMLSQGIMVRSPYIPMPNESEFIAKQSFFTGFFHERRPLSALEIGNLFFNIQRNILGLALITGFSQVAHSEKVKDFMVRGVDISKKHIEMFGSILREDRLTVPMLSGAIATDSKVAPFSDKLMMFHITALIAISIAQYGAGLSTSPRHDLAVNYARLSAELSQYAQDGANLMVENGWLEQPPLNADRKELVKL